MQAVKKVEIVADSQLIADVVKVLDELGVDGYTLIRDVVGKGDRGLKSGDDPAGISRNSYLLSACSEERLGELVERVRPFLKRNGGICLVSDALWVKH